MGLSELRACRSLLRQALVHLLKQHAWPNSQSAAHWRAEGTGFLADAKLAFAPSMGQRIDVPALYQLALQQVQADTDGSGEPLPLSNICPFTLDELLTGDVNALAAMMQL